LKGRATGAALFAYLDLYFPETRCSVALVAR